MRPATLPAQGPGADATTIARTVDSYATRAVSLGLTPALGLAVVKDGKTIYLKSLGLADVTAGVPADNGTLWYVASTSKSYTGFAVALLAQQGVLRLEDPITKLLPQARWHAGVRADDLTLANFLSHTHHLNDNAIVTSAAFTGVVPESRWPELLALAPPTGDSDLVYSNLGYNVAAMVIDRLRPEGWRRYLAEAVYRPAGLTETYAHITGLDGRRIARPTSLHADGTYVTEPFFKTDATMNSAGGHLATLGDLARWVTVQMDSGRIDGRQVLPAEAVALSQHLLARQTRDQARRFAWFDREGWGSGWDIGSYEGERMVSRFGGYHSFRSHLSFLPGRRIGVVAITTGGAGSPLTDMLAALAYDLDAGRPNARSTAEERFAQLVERLASAKQRAARQDSLREARRAGLTRPLSDFVGAYSAPSYGVIRVERRGDSLQFHWGAVYGPVDVFDAKNDQMRFEIAGSGQVAAFFFPTTGPAVALELGGVRFTRQG